MGGLTVNKTQCVIQGALQGFFGCLWARPHVLLVGANIKAQVVPGYDTNGPRAQRRAAVKAYVQGLLDSKAYMPEIRAAWTAAAAHKTDLADAYVQALSWAASNNM
jgi:hypothetical protein